MVFMINITIPLEDNLQLRMLVNPEKRLQSLCQLVKIPQSNVDLTLIIIPAGTFFFKYALENLESEYNLPMSSLWLGMKLVLYSSRNPNGP